MLLLLDSLLQDFTAVASTPVRIFLVWHWSVDDEAGQNFWSANERCGQQVCRATNSDTVKRIVAELIYYTKHVNVYGIKSNCW